MTVRQAFRILRRRFSAIFERTDLDNQLDKELAFHLENLVQENLAAGMSPEEARRSARRAFGNVAILEEQCRDQRRVNWVHDFFQDLRYASRRLNKERSVTLLLILTIALSVGVNTGIFGIINAFLRPLPVRAPEQIVVLAANIKDDSSGLLFRFSYPALQDFRRQTDVFSSLFGFDTEIGGFSTGGKSTQMLYLAVTGNYFSALGISPALGRLFVPGEGENAGADLNIVLGYSFWKGKLGGDPGVIGKQIRLDGQPATVIGVAPPDFHGTLASADIQGYLPLRALSGSADASQIFTDRATRRLTVLGRLKPGISLTQATTAMNIIARRLEQDHPATDKGIRVRIIPEPLARPQPLRWVAEVQPLIASFLAVLTSLVLLLGCMNATSILLAQASVRQHEMSVRAALGAGRGRLIRQMLTESILLALLGGSAGLLAGQFAAKTFAGSIDLATDLPFRLHASFDWRVFAFALGASVLMGVFVGIALAVQTSKVETGVALHDAQRNTQAPQRQRLQSVLVAGQVAGSVVLLVCSGLFVRSLRSLQNLDLGFVPDHVLNARLDPEWAGYDVERTKAFYRELERRVRAWPEVTSASLAFSSPMGYYNHAQSVYIEGRPVAPGAHPPVIGYNSVDAAYFDTMRIPIVRGRAVREADTDTAPRAAVINQTMARTFWPNQDPIGKHFRMYSPNSRPWEVVGIARDSKYLMVFEPPAPYFYVPLAQDFQAVRVLQIRSSVQPESLASRLEHEVGEIDPNVPVSDLQTLARSLNGFNGFLMFRIGAVQATALGLVGLILALIGVYGVVSYGAAQRTREIGIRMALGASPGAVRRLLVRHGTGLVFSGVAAGWIAAAFLTRLLLRFLVLDSQTDPVAFVAIPGCLAAVALLACYIPARRATRIDPTVALRHD
jgi:putative ABC transport system permease protein